MITQKNRSHPNAIRERKIVKNKSFLTSYLTTYRSGEQGGFEMLEHPTITRTLRTGYPYSPRRQEIGIDALGNEVFEGDEILVYEDEFYLVSELSSDAIEILEKHGADYRIARQGAKLHG